MQKLAHKLGEQAIPFRSVRGKTITREEVLSASFDSPPKLGPKSCMLCVLKETEEGGTFRCFLEEPGKAAYRHLESCHHPAQQF